MRLAIADPPYPPFIGSGGRKNRASRWYGQEQRSSTDAPSDFHPDANEWNELGRHRLLLQELVETYDGWAIATSPDGLSAYGPIPRSCRIMAWVKPNGQPGSHRLRSTWEPVIVSVPDGRRSNRTGGINMDDTLTANAPRRGFVGAKPHAWTRWVLTALGYDPATDRVTDLFAGSGAVTEVVEGWVAS